MREIIYCTDCPSIRMCRDEGWECEHTRWIAKAVAEAPPLSREQIRRVATILGRASIEAPPQSRRTSSRHRMGPFKCQVPGCTSAPLRHGSTFWQHLRGIHQLTMGEYREKYGDPEPLTEEEMAAIVVEAHCPVDGCDKMYSTELGNRWPNGAMTSHLRGRHGLKPDGRTPVR